MSYKYNKKNPPVWGKLSPEEFEKEVDIKSFPKCECCGQPIYNPDFYEEEMCGPCLTGESSTLMIHIVESESADYPIGGLVEPYDIERDKQED